MKRKILLTLTILCTVFCYTALAQTAGNIKGRIIDKESREPLIGVSVVLESSTFTGAVTDADGYFTIKAADGAKLAISYIGYKSVSISAKNGMLIELATDVTTLDEVVVVGYGTMKKSDLTGSISSIKGDDLTKLSTPNIISALGGRAPGVRVVSSGAVDGGTKIRIRGIGTVNNSDPLYVVDGFPTGDISYIAPTDIESLEVLKDASATAIYGSRGANGVILITTKKGSVQKTNVTVNAFFGLRKASEYLDVLDAVDYAHARYESYAAANMALTDEAKAFMDYAINNNKKGTDWQKAVTQTGIVQNYNLSVSGGNERVRYNLSGTYSGEEGVLKNSYVNKLFLKFNTEYKVTKAITFGSDISFINWDGSVSELGNLYGASLSWASRVAPIYPVYDQNGNWQKTGGMNAARLNDFEKYKKNHGNKFVGNFSLNIDILKGLSFKSTFGADYNFGRYSSYYPVFYVSQTERNEESSVNETRSSGISWVWSNVANYNFNINKIHSFNLMAGTEASYGSSESISATAYDVPENEYMHYISAAKSNIYQASSGQSRSSIFSTFFRLNYTFKNRYLLTATIRSDASSRFAKENRVGYFPSMSLGWNLKEEAFLKNVQPLSQLKLRTGWGQVGNQSSIGIGEYLSLVDNNLRYVLGDAVYEGRLPMNLSNPNLKWEIAEQFNIGADIAFFDNKLRLNADYFIKKTKDMIVRMPVPSYVGAGSPYGNVGTMENKGFEFNIEHENKIGNVKYNIGLNLSFIKNEVTDLGGAGSMDATAYDRFGSTFRTEVGREIAYYRGLKTDGIFHSQEEIDNYTHTNADGTKQLIQPKAVPGDVKFVDLDGSGAIDEKDLTYLGSYMPNFSGGLNLGLEYKNFFISIFSDFVYGNQIANLNNYELRSGLGTNILQSYYDNRWTPETPNNTEPRLTANPGDNVKFSDLYIEDGSFFRIRNLQFGYDFPRTWMQKIKINKARLYISIDNLCTFTKYTGYNPDIADQYGDPLKAGGDTGSALLPRTISFGLNLNF